MFNLSLILIHTHTHTLIHTHTHIHIHTHTHTHTQKGHEKEALNLMSSYLPKDSANSSPYAEGGGLYAIGECPSVTL